MEQNTVSDFEYFKAHLELVKDATVRSRWAFTSTLAIAFSLICGTFNEVWGWSRSFAFHDGAINPKGIEHNPIMKKYVEAWIDNQTISIPFWGFRFSSYEAPILGGFLIATFSFWLYCTATREHELIKEILDEAEKQDDERVKSFVFNSVRGMQVFSIVAPFKTKTSQGQAAQVRTSKMSTLTASNLAILAYLPGLAAAFAIGAEMYSTCIPSPVTGIIQSQSLFNAALKFGLEWRVIVSFVFALITFGYLKKAKEAQRSIVKLMSPLPEPSNVPAQENKVPTSPPKT